MLFVPSLSTANNTDSLKRVFSNSTNEKIKINSGVELIKAFQGNHDSVVYYTRKILSAWEKQNNQLALAYTYCALCRVYCEEGRYEKAQEYGKRSAVTANKIHNDSIASKSFINMGYTHFTQGDYEKAIKSYFNALTYSEKNGYDKLTASAYNYLGLAFATRRNSDYKMALEYLFKALEIDKRTNNTKDLGFVLLRIGGIYAWQNELDKGAKYINEAERLADSAKIVDLKKWCLEFSADIWMRKKEYAKALPVYFESAHISLRINEIPGIVNSYKNVSKTYENLGDYKKAHLYIDSADFICHKYKALSSVMHEIYEAKSNIYDKQGDLRSAFLYYKKAARTRDSVFSQANANNINELEKKYETEKKEKEISEKNSELEVQKAHSEKQQTQRNAFIIGFAIVMALLVFILRSYRQKQKANEIIKLQKQLVEEKNKDITDSINYAKKIQEAILPARGLKYRLFPEAFILYQPRDIVSGDFYWFTERNGKRLIAAVDCTGHGVPGAFMSMIGNAFLNEIINEKGIAKPSEILRELNALVVSSLKQQESDNRDGMDIAILCFNEDNSLVEFAGANNPCWHIRNGNATEIKGDKKPIGSYDLNQGTFTNHNISLQKGDSLYIFTDGYADQFGGPDGKKFKYKQLEQLILSVQHESMAEQEKLLTARINDWKGNLEQVDDILVIGVKA